jgi:hypothetical protein
VGKFATFDPTSSIALSPAVHLLVIPDMSIFEAYDAEFSALKQEITKNIAEYKDCSAGEKSVPLVKLIDGLLLQSSDLIKQMEIEARSSDIASRKILNEKVSQYKKSIQTVRGDYQQIKTQAEKAALMPVSKSAEQRQRLLDTNDR